MVSFLFPPSLLPSLPLRGTNACCDIDCRPLYPNMHLSSRAPSRERRGSCCRIVCSTLIQLHYSPGWTLDTRAMYHQLLELYSSQSLHLQERKNRCWSTNRENKKSASFSLHFQRWFLWFNTRLGLQWKGQYLLVCHKRGKGKKTLCPFHYKALHRQVDTFSVWTQLQWMKHHE